MEKKTNNYKFKDYEEYRKFIEKNSLISSISADEEWKSIVTSQINPVIFAYRNNSDPDSILHQITITQDPFDTDFYGIHINTSLNSYVLRKDKNYITKELVDYLESCNLDKYFLDIIKNLF